MDLELSVFLDLSLHDRHLFQGKLIAFGVMRTTVCVLVLLFVDLLPVLAVPLLLLVDLLPLFIIIPIVHKRTVFRRNMLNLADCLQPGPLRGGETAKNAASSAVDGGQIVYNPFSPAFDDAWIGLGHELAGMQLYSRCGRLTVLFSSNAIQLTGTRAAKGAY
jgi:hypothetical protein